MSEPSLMRHGGLAVLVLFHEKPDQTLECLESFLGANVPLYVLNNGSSPTSTARVRSFAKRHPEIRFIDSPRNLGVAAGRNLLIRQTVEEWLFFVDNDARVETLDWDRKLYDAIALYPEAEAFVPRIFNVHDASAIKWASIAIENDVLRHEGEPRDDETNLFGGTSIVRRALFDRLGLYDEALFVGFEDVEIAIRALRLGAPARVKILNDISLVHEHRPVTTKEDRKAVVERYRFETLASGFDYLLSKHNLDWEHYWQVWSKTEQRRMLGGPLSRWLLTLRRGIRLTAEDVLQRISAR